MRKEPPISSKRVGEQNDIQSANSYETSLGNNSSSLHEPKNKKDNRLWKFVKFCIWLLLLVFLGQMFEPIIRAKMGASAALVISTGQANATPSDDFISTYEEITEAIESVAESELPCGSAYLALALDKDVQGNFLKLGKLIESGLDLSQLSTSQMQKYVDLLNRGLAAQTVSNQRIADCQSMME